MTNWKLRCAAGLVAVADLALLVCASAAAAQGTADAVPRPPLPATQPPVAVPAVPTAETALEQRLRKLEEDNRQVLQMYKAMARQNAALLKRLESTTPGTAASVPTEEGAEGKVGRRGPAGGGGTGGASGEEGKASRNYANEGYDEAKGEGGVGNEGRGAAGVMSGEGAEGKFGGRNPNAEAAGKPKYVGEVEVPSQKGNVKFAEGLEITSADGEFKWQFHDLTQAELRYFPTQNTGVVHDGFFIPRQRWYVTGQATKNIQFYTVINRGYGSLDLLDAFLTFRYDERLRFRAGRMKTPFNYEYFQIAEGDLVAPERSLYTGNLAGNREVGMMFLGDLFKNRLTYATGVFNGPRRSFEDSNNAKDVYLFLNARPFLNTKDDQLVEGAEGTAGSRLANNSPYEKPNQAVPEKDGLYEHGTFDYFNIGGSINAGYEDGTLGPTALRTSNDQSTSAAAAQLSPTFFQFNSNVVERGNRVQYGGHIAWFVRSLFVLAEYGGGYGTYGFTKGAGSVRLPFSGYNLQASYFITGERITRRVNVVKPISDFRVRNGKISGTGALEFYARYCTLDLGRQAFTGGLADPNDWTNHAQLVDLGLNWYPNFYTKIYLDWEHAIFANPVTRGPSGFENSSNMFWLRFQLFF